MQYLAAVLYGLVQGVTEFFPISSSGHLVILHRLISIPVANELSFDVTLHLATLIAILWYFRRDVRSLILSWLKSFTNLKTGIKDLSWLILLATIPAALAGYFLENLFDNIFRSPMIVAIMMVLVGGLFIVVEKISKQTDDLNLVNWQKALLVGASQAIALIPGTSRSGITTITGMSLNLKREAAIRFSFLLSIPIIAGAAIKELPHLLKGGLVAGEASFLVIAFLVALVSGVFAISFLIRYTKEHSLKVFAYYRFVLAILILLLFR